MARIVISENVSLDGVVEDPGGAEGFVHGGWTFPYWNDEIAAFKLDETLRADALLLGRVTYEGFAAAWPTRTGEFADKFNSMPKHVVSSTLASPGWSSSTVLTGDLAQGVAGLKQRYAGDVLVNGSGTLVRDLVSRRLVDELRLMVFPVVLGAGTRLFDGGDETPLRLVEARPVGPDGVVVLTYRLA